MSFYLGNTGASKIYVGDTAAVAVYLGTEQIWAKPPVFEAVGGGASPGAQSTLNITHNSAGGANCVVLVSISYSSASLTILSCLYDWNSAKIPMTPILVDQTSSYNKTIALFAIFNPPSGNKTIRVALSGNAYITAGSISYQYVAEYEIYPGDAIVNAVVGGYTMPLDVGTTHSLYSVAAHNSSTVTLSAPTTNQFYNSTYFRMRLGEGVGPTITATSNAQANGVMVGVGLPSVGYTHPGGPVFISAAEGGSAASGTTLTWSHFVPYEGCTLFVGAVFLTTSGTKSATYGGVSMTSVGTRTISGNYFVQIFKMENPPVGVADVVVSNGVNYWWQAGSALYGRVSTVSSAVGNNATGTTASVSVTPGSTSFGVVGTYSTNISEIAGTPIRYYEDYPARLALVDGEGATLSAGIASSAAWAFLAVNLS